MSSISSLGSSASSLNQMIQAAASKQNAKAPAQAPAQASHPSAGDADHDGDSDGGGIDKTA